MTEFVNFRSISVDHVDPSVFTVVPTESRDPAAELESVRISEGVIAFMCELNRLFTITEYAMKHDKLLELDPKIWDDLVGNFTGHFEGSRVSSKWNDVEMIDNFSIDDDGQPINSDAFHYIHLRVIPRPQ